MVSYTLLAYVDPVSGFIFLQMILAGLVGSIAFFRKWLWKAACLLTGRAKRVEGDKPDMSTHAE